jgi:hypothetical protein
LNYLKLTKPTSEIIHNAKLSLVIIPPFSLPKFVCNFSVATSEEWLDKATKQKKQKVEWHNISVFGKLAFNSGSPPKFPTIITLLIPAIFFSYFFK